MEPTQTLVIDDLKRQNESLNEQLAEANSTISRQSAQIDNLRQNIGTVKDLPPEVAADVRDRMAAGLPREIAIERALEQHAHNKKLIEALPDNVQDRTLELMEENNLSTHAAITQAQVEKTKADRAALLAKSDVSLKATDEKVVATKASVDKILANKAGEPIPQTLSTNYVEPARVPSDGQNKPSRATR
jgi:hypothetical protein